MIETEVDDAETTNAARRLHRLLADIQGLGSTSTNESTADALVRLLTVDGDEGVRATSEFETYSLLNSLVNSVDEQVKANVPEQQYVLFTNKWIGAVRRLFSFKEAFQLWSKTKRLIDANVLHNVEVLAVHLDSAGCQSESEIGKDELTSLISSAQALMEGIERSGALDEETKSRLRLRVYEVMISLQNFRYFGSSGLTDRFDGFLGAMVLNGDRLDQDPDLSSKARNFMAAIAPWVQIVSTLAQLAAAATPLLPE